MGLLKGILGKTEKADQIDDSASQSAFAAAEAAVDRAIKERQAAEAGEQAPAEAPSSETLVERGEDRRKAVRRQGEAGRPGGLPERRSGQDRRAPRAFGRRGVEQD